MIVWFDEKSAHQDIRPAGLVHDGRPKLVVLISKKLESLGERPISKLGAAADDHSSWLAASMRINDFNFLHGADLKELVVEKANQTSPVRYRPFSMSCGAVPNTRCILLFRHDRARL